jgi:cyclopropane-fatty-acyl-phospholipid synthase
MVRAAVRFAESGFCPDPLLRAAIRQVCRRRLRELCDDVEEMSEQTTELIRSVSRGPIAVMTDHANEQHYEVPAAFFVLVLGHALKYSSCYWSADTSNLDQAEIEALERTCNGAQLEDGQHILELGCGWGSLTLHMARKFPKSSIVAVSNSASQKRHIAARARALGLDNVEVITADINDFESAQTFDRVVSVEMFEHMRNHRELLKRISRWLGPNGKLLVHVFCGGLQPYLFENRGEDDWMARHFFSGGIMPSDDLLLRFPEHLWVEQTWRWSGRHYARTAEAWLSNLDAHRDEAMCILAKAGAPDPRLAVNRWRIFFLACAELFGFERGNRWWVCHYRFAKRPQ